MALQRSITRHERPLPHATSARPALPGRSPPATCLRLGLRGLPVDELAAARYLGLRRAMWRALLEYLPAVEPVCALAHDILAPELCPTPALARLDAAARVLRRSDDPLARAEFEAACEAAAAQLGSADPDGLLCDRLVADLTELELGRDNAAVPIHLSPAVLRFSHYVAAVRLHYDAAQATANAVLASVGPLDAVVRRLRSTCEPTAPLQAAAEDGLRRALGRFEPRRGLPFSICAAWWVGRAIDHQAGPLLPRAPRAADRSTRRLIQEFGLVHGRPPCADELALLGQAAVHSHAHEPTPTALLRGRPRDLS
jgi:hypothetical protein